MLELEFKNFNLRTKFLSDQSQHIKKIGDKPLFFERRFNSRTKPL